MKSSRLIRRGILLLTFAFTLGELSAAEVDSLRARTAARNFYLNMLAKSQWRVIKSVSGEIQLSLVQRSYAGQRKSALRDQAGLSNPLYYVFDVNESDGFVIVAGDDRLPPVLAYAFQGSYPVDDAPPAMQQWLSSYQEQIEYILGRDHQADQSFSQDWKKILSVSSMKDADAVNEVLPLLSTTWNQGKYYNDKCPEDERCWSGRVPVGCLAVAVAQVMKYWDHPGSATSIPGYLDPVSYENDEAVPESVYGCIPGLESTAYNWSDMPDRLDENSLGSQVDAVSEFLYHTGVACRMNYGPYGSSAYSWDAHNALKNYFHYHPSLYFTCQDEYSEEEWSSLLRTELDQDRPVYMQGSGTGCHAFVCDGYQDVDYYHFNWGWGGSGDGYYYLNNLNPEASDFSEDQCAIVGVEPAPMHGDPYEKVIHIGGSGPAHTQTVQTGGAGDWDFSVCYRSAPGAEQLFSFTSADTGLYAIEVLSANSSLDYAFRRAECAERGWRCVCKMESQGRGGPMPLASQTTYHLLVDDSDTISSRHEFYIHYLGLPELACAGIEIDDDSISSQGNNNGGAEPGELVEIRIRLTNSGTADLYGVRGVLSSEDTLISILDDYESYGDILAGEEAVCGADFDISIPADYPGNTTVPLELEVSSYEGRWTLPLSIVVYEKAADPCSRIISILGTGPENRLEFKGGSLGAWNQGLGGKDTPGMEQVYAFVPPDTGIYSIEAIPDKGPVMAAWQSGECRPGAWNPIAVIDEAGSYTSVKWDADSSYYLLFDDLDTIAGSLQFYLDCLGMPDLGYASYEVEDQTHSGSGNGNGLADPGERFLLKLALKNEGSCMAHQVRAILSVLDTTVIIYRDSIGFEDIAAGGTCLSEAGFDLSLKYFSEGNVELPCRLAIRSAEEDWEDVFNLRVEDKSNVAGDQTAPEFFSLFPNPAGEMIQIGMPESACYTVDIEAADGRKILHQDFSGDHCRIDLRSFPPGYYLVRVSSKGVVGTKAFIKIKGAF